MSKIFLNMKTLNIHNPLTCIIFIIIETEVQKISHATSKWCKESNSVSLGADYILLTTIVYGKI